MKNREKALTKTLVFAIFFQNLRYVFSRLRTSEYEVVPVIRSTGGSYTDSMTAKSTARFTYHEYHALSGEGHGPSVAALPSCSAFRPQRILETIPEYLRMQEALADPRSFCELDTIL